MSITLMCMPIKKGKTDSYKAFIMECLGPKKDDYKDLLLRYGLNTVQMWINTINGKDYAIFTHDMSDDAAKLLESWANSKHPFDQWFNKQLENHYEMESLSKAPPQPLFIGVLDARKL